MDTSARTRQGCFYACKYSLRVLPTALLLNAALSVFASPASHADRSQIELLESGMDRADRRNRVY